MSPSESLSRGWAIWALAGGQFLGYACQFFAFAGLVLAWTADLGWSKSTLALGPMVAALVAAALAPLVGRVVDAGRGPELMVTGSLIGALTLAAMAGVTAPWQWIALWLVSGVGQIASQYEVCFAFLIRRLGPDARRAIIRVTLVTGFASLLAIPAYAAVAAAVGWRLAMLGAAGVMLFAVLPLNWLGTRAIRRGAPPPQIRPSPEAASSPAARRRALRLLAVVFSLIALSHWSVAHLLVPLLIAKGFSAQQAVFAAAVIGPVQVAGRFSLIYFENRVSNAVATRAIILAMVLGTALLAAAGIGYPVVLAYVLLQGAAIGILTILRPVLIADVLGPENYGANAGKIQLPSMTAGALAPMLGALMLEGPGGAALVGLSLGLMVMALLTLHLLLRAPR